MSRRFLVVGDVMTDVITTVDHPLAFGSDTAATVRTRQGGAGANVAVWLSRHGVPVTFVGVVGEDPFGAEAISELAAGGVEPRVRRTSAAATGACVVLVGSDAERTMLPDAGANSLLAEADLPAQLVAGSAHLHVSGYTVLNPGSRPAGLAALRAAIDAGVPTSIDPASAAPLEAVGGGEFRRLTEGVGLIFVTLEEAEVLCEHWDPRVIGARLTASYGEVVLKLGADGAHWFGVDDPEGVEVGAATPPGPVVDSTGAGDAFAAAFLAARWVGADPQQALHTATRAAADVVTGPGARSTAKTGAASSSD